VDATEQITLAFRHICTRAPRATELNALTELYAQQKAQPPQVAPAAPAEPEPKPDPKANRKRSAAPAKPASISTDPALAALTLVCSTILASDAAVTSR
jgi:hypothetical protein